MKRWHWCPVMGLIVRAWPVSVWYQRRRDRYNAEIDRQYKEAYERVPLDTPDDWGDMESCLEEMHRSPGQRRG